LRALAAIALIAVSACAQAPAGPREYTGYLRQGFEQSDFYPAGGGGPWWVTLEEGEHATLDTLATGQGRGRAIVVQITAQGVEKGPVDFAFRPKFANSLHITKIVDAQKVSEEKFREIADRAGR
jgi:hypothetical protein